MSVYQRFAPLRGAALGILCLTVAGLAGCTGGATRASHPGAADAIAAQPAVLRTTAEASPYRAHVPQHGKAILVNIPSFELIAFEDGKVAMRSRVIIGKPSTPTPVMDTETSVVRFRPTWTPTPSMIRSGKYRPGTRPAGPRNPLGFLAIRLEPGMLIYLHGTNKPQLFDEKRRALSHGCVRVERWDDLAAWVLDRDVGDIHEAAYGRRTYDAQTGGIPVFIQYNTEFPDANGVMQTWPDVYRRGSFATGPLTHGVF